MTILVLQPQVYKSTGDYAAGKTLYDFYSAVYDVQDPHFLSLRDIVLKRKQPRKMFVQCNTVLEGEQQCLNAVNMLRLLHYSTQFVLHLYYVYLSL